jgi:hypothetical protein
MPPDFYQQILDSLHRIETNNREDHQLLFDRVGAIEKTQAANDHRQPCETLKEHRTEHEAKERWGKIEALVKWAVVALTGVLGGLVGGGAASGKIGH